MDPDMDLNKLTSEIHAWMSRLENNALEPGSDLPAFDLPLVGCASATDELFLFIKNDIGADFYWSPDEAFNTAFPAASAGLDELSVVAWALPQTGHTKDAHRKASGLPSREWSLARHFGEKVNERLRQHVVDFLHEHGIKACAPALLPEWSRALSEKYGFASRWSERHTAHVCGLGTFGLSDGLITPAGKAVRVGSVVVRARFAPTPRPYTRHNEWCLFLSGGKCRACIKRCPAGALSEAGHDKEKCKAYIRNTTALFVQDHQLGFKVNSCGLCQTKVPCESGIPKKIAAVRTQK